ncbi:MAG: hypothetical protein QXL94_04440 [Candidatus Parvarchaeum sp.]
MNSEDPLKELIIDWIISLEDQGFTDEQIRAFLITGANAMAYAVMNRLGASHLAGSEQTTSGVMKFSYSFEKGAFVRMDKRNE